MDRRTFISGITLGLLAALGAFVQEHRRCGELDGGVDGCRIWMACDCGADIVHPVEPPSSKQLD